MAKFESGLQLFCQSYLSKAVLVATLIFLTHTKCEQPNFRLFNDVTTMNHDVMERKLVLFTNTAAKCNNFCGQNVKSLTGVKKRVNRYQHSNGKCECFLVALGEMTDVTKTAPKQSVKIYTVDGNAQFFKIIFDIFRNRKNIFDYL